MAWRLEWLAKTERELKKLDPEVQRRVHSKLNDCIDNPYHYATRLTNLPYYRVRVGKYRIILDLDENVLTVVVMKIDRRGRVYDR